MTKLSVFVASVLLSVSFLNSTAQSLPGAYPLDNSGKDYSAHGNNGTTFNRASTTNRYGSAGKATLFSGDNSSIVIDDAPFRSNRYTIGVWFKLSELPASGSYFSILSIGGEISDQSLLVGNNSQFNHIGLGFGSYDEADKPHSCYVGTLPEVGKWYYATICRDETKLSLYLNGKYICSSQTDGAAGYTGVKSKFTVGSRLETDFQNFKGSIDDLLVYNYARTAPQIEAMQNSDAYTASGVNEANIVIQEDAILVDSKNNTISLVGNLKDMQLISLTGQVIKLPVTGDRTYSTASVQTGIYIARSANSNGLSISRKIMID